MSITLQSHMIQLTSTKYHDTLLYSEVLLKSQQDEIDYNIMYIHIKKYFVSEAIQHS